MSLKQTGEAGEPHGISGKRILANVTLFTMLGLGFMYQQTTEWIKLEPTEIDTYAELDQAIEAETAAEKESTEKEEIVKAIGSYRLSLDEDDIASLATIVQAESKKYDYDWKLILAIIRAESHFDTQAESDKGARGLMQVLPSTAKWLSPRMGLEYTGRDSLYDPEYNIKLGTHYLHMLHKKFGNIEKAIAAYNRGPSGLRRYLNQGREFPSLYLAKVMDYYKKLKGVSDEYSS